ncbi:Phosphatidylglycerol/phosphatidylinositol transfer protein [Cichlidogyrus casuarinus]|uniref:Phosphatidylglycerol/phosphatidylinositol transfer protein n=1 Tax=Cichlidogyrus casuarinus TaxID=1844966 RepID=A0ABD2PP44_9PLAT
MVTKALVLVLAYCLFLSNVNASRFKDCGSKFSQVSAVDVSPCPSEPCPLIKNENSTVTITFNPTEDVSGGYAQVHGIIAHVPLPFNLPDTTLCPHLIPSGCPMAKGQKAIYNFTLPISSSYPSISVIIRWELVDQNGNDIVCVDFPAKIVSQFD